MMPEPTTAASRKAVPSASATIRCGSGVIRRAALAVAPSRRPISVSRWLQAQRIKAADRKGREHGDPLLQPTVGFREGEGDLRLRAGRFGGIACVSSKKEEVMMKDKIKEGMEVIGADGVHVGTVDRVVGDRIKLKKRDSHGAHEGHHHYIELGFVAGVEGQRVRLSANAEIAVTLEEEKSGRPTPL